MSCLLANNNVNAVMKVEKEESLNEREPYMNLGLQCLQSTHTHPSYNVNDVFGICPRETRKEEGRHEADGEREGFFASRVYLDVVHVIVEW